MNTVQGTSGVQSTVYSWCSRYRVKLVIVQSNANVHSFSEQLVYKVQMITGVQGTDEIWCTRTEYSGVHSTEYSWCTQYKVQLMYIEQRTPRIQSKAGVHSTECKLVYTVQSTAGAHSTEYSWCTQYRVQLVYIEQRTYGVQLVYTV